MFSQNVLTVLHEFVGLCGMCHNMINSGDKVGIFQSVLLLMWELFGYAVDDVFVAIHTLGDDFVSVARRQRGMLSICQRRICCGW